MEKTCQKNINKIVFAASFVLVYLAFQCFYNLHFSIDSYDTYLADKQNAFWHIQNGRLVFALIVYAVDFIGLNLLTNNVLWVNLFMFVLAWSIATLTLRIMKYANNDFTNGILVFLFVCLSFVHAFMAEWFQFTECLLMYSVSVFCAVAAALVFPLNSTQNKSGYIISLLLLTIAYNCYQVGICFFVFYILCFIFLENKGRFCVNAVKSTIGAAFTVVLTFAMNMVIIKLLIKGGVIGSSSRMSTISLENIKSNLVRFFSSDIQFVLWMRGNEMLKAPDLLVLSIIMFIAALFASISLQKKWYDVVYAFTLLSGGILALMAPILLTDTFWMAPRTIVPLFCIYAYLGCMVAESTNKRLKQILCILLIVALARQTWFINNYSVDVLKSNSCDKIWTEYVISEIEKYENSNDITISHIGVSRNDSLSYFWDDIDYRWDVCNRAVSIEWATTAMISYYADKPYEKVSVPEDMVANFKNSESECNIFDTQISFCDNKCYIYIK